MKAIPTLSGNKKLITKNRGVTPCAGWSYPTRNQSRGPSYSLINIYTNNMNKPITSRVRQATSGSRGVQEPLLNVGAAGVRGGAATRKQASPLKSMAAGDIISKEARTAEGEAASENPGLIAQGRASGGNTSLISGASKVGGTSSTIPRATDINAAASSAESGKSGFTGSTTIGGAIQRNIAARIDKAGELGRARRDARRAGKSGVSVNAAPSAEKAARDKRVDAVIGGNSSASALDNKMPSVDLVGMGAKAKGATEPSAQDIRKKGRATRAQVRQDKLTKNQAARGEAKDARVSARKAGKDLKNADRIFGKNNVEVTADKGPSNRAIKRSARKESNASEKADRQEIRGVEKAARQETRSINKEARKAVGKDGEVISNKEMRSRGREFNKLERAENKTERQAARDQKSLSKASDKVVKRATNKKSEKITGDFSKAEDKALLTQARDEKFLNKRQLTRAKNKEARVEKREDRKEGRENKKALRQTSRANVSANGTPERPENKSIVSAAQMRMNSNVGMKSKSPMKKGYFKGM